MREQAFDFADCQTLIQNLIQNHLWLQVQSFQIADPGPHHLLMYFLAASVVHYQISDPVQHLVGSVVLVDCSVQSVYLLPGQTSMTLPDLWVAQKVPEALKAPQVQFCPMH